MANVRQSDDGAKEVIGSKMVREDICSDVDGSKSKISPFSLPAQ